MGMRIIRMLFLTSMDVFTTPPPPPPCTRTHAYNVYTMYTSVLLTSLTKCFSIYPLHMWTLSSNQACQELAEGLSGMLGESIKVVSASASASVSSPAGITTGRAAGDGSIVINVVRQTQIYF